MFHYLDAKLLKFITRTMKNYNYSLYYLQLKVICTNFAMKSRN